MSLNKAVEDLKFDSRLTDINIRLGRVTPEEIKKHIESLENLEAQAEKIEIEKSENNPEN